MVVEKYITGVQISMDDPLRMQIGKTQSNLVKLRARQRLQYDNKQNLPIAVARLRSLSRHAYSPYVPFQDSSGGYHVRTKVAPCKEPLLSPRHQEIERRGRAEGPSTVWIPDKTPVRMILSGSGL